MAPRKSPGNTKKVTQEDGDNAFADWEDSGKSEIEVGGHPNADETQRMDEDPLEKEEKKEKDKIDEEDPFYEEEEKDLFHEQERRQMEKGAQRLHERESNLQMLNIGHSSDKACSAFSIVLPLIASGGFIFIMVVMWKNVHMLSPQYPKNLPVILSVVGGILYAGILLTFYKCLSSANAEHMAFGGCAWISFWFIASLVLLAASAWTFFKKHKPSTTAFLLLFVWISGLALVFFSASCWPPGLIFTISYLAGVTWLWAVSARDAFNAMGPNDKMSKLLSKIIGGKDKVAVSTTPDGKPFVVKEVSDAGMAVPGEPTEPPRNEDGVIDLFAPATGTSPLWRSGGDPCVVNE